MFMECHRLWQWQGPALHVVVSARRFSRLLLLVLPGHWARSNRWRVSLPWANSTHSSADPTTGPPGDAGAYGAMGLEGRQALAPKLKVVKYRVT